MLNLFLFIRFTGRFLHKHGSAISPAAFELLLVPEKNLWGVQDATLSSKTTFVNCTFTIVSSNFGGNTAVYSQHINAYRQEVFVKTAARMRDTRIDAYLRGVCFYR